RSQRHPGRIHGAARWPGRLVPRRLASPASPHAFHRSALARIGRKTRSAPRILHAYLPRSRAPVHRRKTARACSPRLRRPGDRRLRGSRMIFRSLAELKAGFGPCAMTIGNFDGVHLGHQEILRTVVALAREHGWKAAALTFDPHPTKLVAPAEAPHL